MTPVVPSSMPSNIPSLIGATLFHRDDHGARIGIDSRRPSRRGCAPSARAPAARPGRSTAPDRPGGPESGRGETNSRERSRKRSRGGGCPSPAAGSARPRRAGARAVSRTWRRPLAGTAQVRGDRRGHVATVEGADVGRLGGVQQVPGREHPGRGRPQRRVDQWAERAAVELAAGHHRQLVVGDPVRGEDDQVAFDRPGPAGVELGQLDRLDPLRAVDRADRRPRPDRRPVADAPLRPGRPSATGAWAAP